MAHQPNCRPAGLSEEESDEGDYYGGESDNDDFHVGFVKARRTMSCVNSQETEHAPPKLEESISTPSPVFRSQATTTTSALGCGGVPGIGRGRGRGRGALQKSTPPPPQEPHAQMEDEEEEEPRRSWCGRARGAPINNRHRRRSGSSSPTPGGSDKRKLKEALLKRVPNFGTVVKQEIWARDVSKQLKGLWDTDQKILKPEDKKFTRELQTVFEKCECQAWNVPSLALFLVINSSDFLAPQGSKNQAQTICQGLQKYQLTPAPHVTTTTHISFSEDLKKVAFEAAVFQKKESLMKLILESFQLTTHQSPSLKSFLLQEIHKLIQRKEYTEACFCATHLKLHASFDIHAFLVPLILQDKPAVVEDFLNNAPPEVQHQRQLVKFLDEQFQYGNSAVYGQLLQYRSLNKIPDTKDDKFNYKPISKLIKRLRTKYNLGFDCCPNIGHRQRFGELRHMFARRYEKNEMSAEGFAELIDQLSEENTGLREDILNHYLEYQDYLNAARFIISHEMFSSPACQNQIILGYLPEPWKSEWEEKLRRNLTMEEECWEVDDSAACNATSTSALPQDAETRTSKEEEEEESWEDDKLVESKPSKMANFYCHPFPRSSIYIISDPHEVLGLCNALAQLETTRTTVISGVDSEWKPIMSKNSGAALLQIAFEDGIHLIDLVTLKQALKRGYFQEPCVWKALRRDYFENEYILKLGFDLRNDVKMLTETVPQWQGLNTSWCRMLDLSSLKSLILKECPHLFHQIDGSIPSTDGESGLSELVYLCTNKRLSKDEQMSDWEKRPLREPQVLYAASDAYCLITVYRALEDLCVVKGVNLERIVANYFKGLANGGTNGNGGGASSSKKKKGSVELVLDLCRLPGMTTEETKEDTGCVKLVVDTMLLGLGRYLRSLGFDTVMLGNHDGHELCVNYVRREGRRIITRGLQAYGRIAGRLEKHEQEKMMYLVKSESTAAQLEEICRHFNVTLNSSRLFTICFRCNTSVFINTSLALMFSLMEIAGCHLIQKPTTSTGEVDQKALIQSLEMFKNKSFDDMILYVGEQEETSKRWTLLGDEDSIKITDGGRIVFTAREERVELTRLQMVSHLIDQIYICNGCGKCYWSSRLLEKYYQGVK